MPGSVSRVMCYILHVTHAKCTLLTTWVVVVCMGMSAEIALCLLFKLYANDGFVSEVPVTVMHASAMS